MTVFRSIDVNTCEFPSVNYCSSLSNTGSVDVKMTPEYFPPGPNVEQVLEEEESKRNEVGVESSSSSSKDE